MYKIEIIGTQKYTFNLIKVAIRMLVKCKACFTNLLCDKIMVLRAAFYKDSFLMSVSPRY